MLSCGNQTNKKDRKIGGQWGMDQGPTMNGRHDNNSEQ